MRVLLAMLMLASAGCDQYWASFIQRAPAIGDGGTTCATAGDCDLATMPGTADDLQQPGCSTSAMCPGGSPFCDLNTGSCLSVPPPIEAFPAGAPFETFIPLAKPYMLMATGDYDGDLVADVAVSGVFSPVGNATGADNSGVDIYRGDGQGGLKLDASCAIPVAEKPVYLLTIPVIGKANDFLVATLGANIYRCSKSSGSWIATTVSVAGAVPTGFKQIALSNNEGQTTTDLTIRTSKNLYSDATGSGSLDTHRSNGNNYIFNGTTVTSSTSDVTWVMPYRLVGSTSDNLALTWDNMMAHPGIEFHYIKSTDIEASSGSGSTSSADVVGTGFPELGTIPLAALALFHVAGQNTPSILFAYSQNPNSVSVLYGASAPVFAVQSQQKNLPQGGLMLPYAGDANGDGQDEVGLRTMALNGNALTRHLLLLAYKGNAINVAAPITDIPSVTEDYRAMALEFLSNSTDRRRLAKRKDLIALVENPTGGTSRLLIRRANLNYTSF